MKTEKQAMAGLMAEISEKNSLQRKKGEISLSLGKQIQGSELRWIPLQTSFLSALLGR